MFFSLEVLRARKGDCFLLHYGRDERRLIIIDGGPSDVFKPHLKPRLDQLRAQRAFSGAGPLPVDVLMVSHVDDDHIKGILELTRELRQAKAERKPQPVRVRSLWHNSFDKLLHTTPDQLKQAQQFGVASLDGDLSVDEEIDADAARVLVSIPQGFKLREDAKFLEWGVNGEFGEELVMATGEPKVVALGDGLRFTVAGPKRSELEELKKKHDAWVKSEADKEAQKVPAAYLDRSVPNLSSIVLLAELGGKRMLLTGDARGDMILEGLELVKALEPGGAMRVDLLKVPHHGSPRNMETGFFQRVTADHYVFSGDGEHGNPARATLEMLLDARGQHDFTMHFTYPIEEIDEKRKEDWNKERSKEIARREKNGTGIVREGWDPDQHALATLFRSRGLPDAKRKVEIVQAGKPHLIDLHAAVAP